MKIYKYILPALLLIYFVGCNSPREIKNVECGLMQKFGKLEGTDNEVMGYINCFAIDKDENLYVADGAFKTIKKFSKEGIYQRSFGFGEGKGPGEHLVIQDMDVDSLNNLYIVDKVLRRLTVFDSLNNVQFIVPLHIIPAQIIVPQSLHVFIVGFPFTSNKKIIYTYDLSQKDFTSPVNNFCEKVNNKDSLTIDMTGNAGRLTKDSCGNILYSFFFPYETRVYSLSGKLLKSFSRDVSFYIDPYFDNKKRYVVSPAGNRGLLLFPPDLLVNVIYKQNGEDEPTYYFDFFNYKTKKYLGIVPTKDIGIEKIRYIKTDSKGYIYLDIFEPYPQILKYKLTVKS